MKKKIAIKCGECKKEFEIKRKWQVFCCAKCRFKHWAKKHPRIGITIFILLILCQTVNAGIDLDRWADAIRKAENNDNYGIISIKCDPKTDQCRRYCKNTVYNTLVKYRTQRCRAGEDDLSCLARRYCPVGSDTDNGTCQYWKKNVEWFLNNP